MAAAKESYFATAMPRRRRRPNPPVPTGLLSLDHALGLGGFPRTAIVDIYGAEATGKTTLALHLISEMQKRNGEAAYIDADDSLRAEYAGAVGADAGRLTVLRPGCAEAAFAQAREVLYSRVVDLLVLDSLTALSPSEELLELAGDEEPFLENRLLSSALRRLNLAVWRTDATLVLINNVRRRPTGEETTLGGMAPRLYSTVRVELRLKQRLVAGGQTIGSRIAFHIIKNKLAAPRKMGYLDLIFGQGFSRESDILEICRRFEIAPAARLLTRRRSEAIEWLKAHRDEAAELEKLAREALEKESVEEAA